MNAEDLARAIADELSVKSVVNVEGLGRFERDSSGKIKFSRTKRPRIFVAYANEDAALADRLYADLEECGYSPWMDRRKLLPGQNWPRRIQDAIESSDFFIGCFSSKSVSKRGGFQAEIRYAMDCATRIPLDDVFLIPVRLDECKVPARIQRETQYIDLFPDWKAGIALIMKMIERQRLLAA
jgi:hypothetical protein